MPNPWEVDWSKEPTASLKPWEVDWSKAGPEKPVDGGFMPSAKQAIGAVIKGAGQAAADFIPGVGGDNPVKRYGQSVIDANPTVVQDFESAGANPLKTVTEATGNAAGSVGGIVGARLVGQGITAAAPLTGPFAPATALLGQAVAWFGPAAIAALPSYGGIRDKQILNDPDNNEDWKSKAVASLGAATVGAIETKFGPQQWALSALTKEGRASLASKFAETSVSKAIGFGALKGAAIEGAEELVQNPIEQLASYDNPLTKKSLKDTAFGGFMGAVGGGVLGGATGGIIGSRKTDQPSVTDIATAPTADAAIQAFVGSVSQGDAAVSGIINNITQGDTVRQQQAAQAFGAEKGLLASLPSIASLPARGTAQADAADLNDLVATETADLQGKRQGIIQRAADENDAYDLNDLVSRETQDLDVLRANARGELQKQNQTDQLQAQTREQLGRLPDQQVAAANAATVEAPTAMQLAMQRAMAGRTEPPAGPTPPVGPPPAPPAGPSGPTTNPDLQPGDIARKDGSPFQSENGARLKQREAGGIANSDIAPVAGGFVVRPKPQPQENVNGPQAEKPQQVPARQQEAPANPEPAAQPAASSAVPAPAEAARAPAGVNPGKVLSTYTGKFGKGMGKDAAKLEAGRLNRTNDGITYTAEEHGQPLENPWAVVGRKPNDKSAMWKGIVDGASFENRQKRVDAEILTEKSKAVPDIGKIADLQETKADQAASEQLRKDTRPAANDAGVAPSQAASGPEYLGRNSIPLSEGGKPFKTNRDAKKAKRNQPMLRVKTVPGGFALAPATEAQIAAQEAAAKRLGTARIGNNGLPAAAHQFIAGEGGLNPSIRSDLGVEGNPRIGNRTLYARAGAGLTLEQATEALKQDGYLGENASHTDALNLIRRSMTVPQYTPEGAEVIAQVEANARFEDFHAAELEAAQSEDFDPFESIEELGFSMDDAQDAGYDEALDPIKLEVNALLQQAEALGIDTDTIKEQAHEDTRNGSEQDFYEAARDSLQAAIEGSNGNRSEDAGQPGDAPSEGLTAPTREEVVAQKGIDQQTPQNLPEIENVIRLLRNLANKRLIPDETTLRELITQPLVGADRAINVNVKRFDLARTLGLKVKRVAQRGSDALVLSIEAGDSPFLNNTLAEIKTIIQDQGKSQANVDGESQLSKIEQKDNETDLIAPSRQNVLDQEDWAEQAEESAKAQQIQWFDGVEQRTAIPYGDAGQYVVKGRKEMTSGIDGVDTIKSKAELDALIKAESQPPTLDLEAPTPEALKARDERQLAAIKAEKAQQKAKDEIARREQDRKDIAARSVGAADSFTLGGDAEQNLTGQGGMFDTPQEPAEKEQKSPSQQNSEDRHADARRIGKEAAERGDPRDPPTAFTNTEKQVWRAGWDDAKKTKVTPQVAPAAKIEDIGPMFSRTPDQRADNFKKWSNDAPLVTSAQADTHDFKTGEKIVVEAYHGTARPDRVGTEFKRKRATSGPMSFFTSAPELASSYATGKQDTSIADDDRNYANWFSYKPKGERRAVDIVRAWNSLTPEQKQEVAKLAPRVKTDNETGENIELGPETNQNGNGAYDWELQQTKTAYNRQGNPLKALVESWLTSGSLFDQEERFTQVLKLAGFPVKDVEFTPSNASNPFVYKTYIAMQKPLVTSDVPADVMTALQEAAKRDRSRAQPQYADMWDKNTRTLREWVQNFADPENKQTAFVWTSIPDKVTDVFKSLGYDGIVDWSGKGGGHAHPVYIPFAENQVKSAIGNKGTFDAGKKNILFSRATLLEPVKTSSGTAFRNSQIVFARPRNNPRQPENGLTRVDYWLRDPVLFAQARAGGMSTEDARDASHVGVLTMDVDGDGQFKSLRNILVFDSKRGSGYGEKAVGSIMQSLPDNARLYLHDILPGAVDFWDKMGAKFPRSDDFMEASLSPQQFRNAYDARTRSGRATDQSQEPSRTADAQASRSGREADGRSVPGKPQETRLTNQASPQDAAAVDRLNEVLANYFGSDEYGMVPHTGREASVSRPLQEAIRAAFGKRVVAVAAAPGSRDAFNGFVIPSRPDEIFVNANSNVGFVQIAGHELWHAIKKQRPDLIAWYQTHSRQFYKDLPAYQTRLNALLQPGEKPYNLGKAEEELEADFMGDSLADPAFLQTLADASPTKFKELMGRIRLWLAGVMNKIKGLGSEKEIIDVKALQVYLKDVMVAYAEGKNIPAAPVFSRGTNDAMTNKDVVGNSQANPADDSTKGANKAVDSNGKPVTVYHGTPRTFDKFEAKHISSGMYGEGFYFTNLEKDAELYAEGGRVIPATLTINNPASRAVAEEAAERIGEDDYAGIREELERMGYDGVIAHGSNGGEVIYVAFKPEQINQGGRSADDISPGVLKDATGKPLSLYHGGLVWDKFDSKESGREALWLTPDVNVASGYGDQYSKKDGREIKAFNVRMDRPLDLTKPEVVNQVFGEDNAPAQHDIARDRSVIEQALKYAKDNGYDGMIHPDSDNFNRYTNGQISYAVFSPDQLQLAPLTGNEEDYNTYGIPLRGKPNEPTAPDSGDAPAFSRSLITGKPLPQTWQAPDATRMDNVIYAMQDKHVDTKRVVTAVREKIGTLADELDPYLQEELYHGRTASATKKFLENGLRPLLTEMQARSIDLSDFEEYLHNRHAERRNVQVAKVNPKMQDGGSGINTADARAYLAGLTVAKRTAYQALAKRVDQINRDTRNLLVSSGLEKQATIDAWQAAYGDEYVPLMREEMDAGTAGIGQGFSVRGGSSKRALGSDKPVANILANIALQREKAITRTEKQKIGHALYGMVLAAPNDKFWFAVDPQLAQSEAQITATALQLIDLGLNPADAQSIAKEPTERYIDPRNGQVAERINPALRSADNVLAVRIDGEDKYVFFNAQDARAMRMAKALKNLDADQLGAVMGSVAKVTRYFAAINTQYNPIFGVVNLTRDVQTAVLNLQSTALKGKQADVMTHVVSALRGIYIDLRDHRAGKQPSSTWAQLFEEFQREGGATGYRDMYANPQERADALVDELKAIKDGKALKLGKGIMGWLSDYNESMENAVRVATYKVGKESGLSNQQAASLAKNLTVNFNRGGQVKLQVGALYAFFNASVQGTARMGQTMFKDGKLSGLGKKILTGGLLLGSMQALLLAAAGFDDDEPPDFVRERSLIIPDFVFNSGKYLSIPMPLGFHVIPNLGRIPTEWAMGGFKNTPKRLAQMVGLFADAFNPIGSAGLSLQTLTPTVIDPLAALAENRDFTGKPIARKDFNSLKPTAGHTRAKDTATPWAKAISYALNMATGGTDYTPGEVSPTPDQIDYLIGQATGGVGREAGKFAQSVGGASTGEEVPLYKIPLIGRFVGTTEGQAAEASRFYNNLKEIGLHDTELDGLRKDRRMAEAAQYLREHPQAMLVKMADKTQREVSKLNKSKRELVKAGASPERVKLIEQQITARMAVLNQRVKIIETRETATP